MINIKKYKQFNENNNSFEIISEVFFNEENKKNNLKKIDGVLFDKLLYLLNRSFYNYNIIFKNNDFVNDNDDDCYSFVDKDETNTIYFFRTDDDMLLFNLYVPSYNMVYEKFYRIDQYSSDDEMGVMFDDMFDFFYDNYVLGVNAPNDEEYEDINESNMTLDKTYKEISEGYFMDDRNYANKEDIEEFLTESIRNIIDDEFGYFITEIFENDNDIIYQGFDKVSNFIIEFFKISDDWVLLFLLSKGRVYYYKIDFYDLVQSIRNIMLENKLQN